MRYATGRLMGAADCKWYHCHAELLPSAEDIVGPFLWAALDTHVAYQNCPGLKKYPAITIWRHLHTHTHTQIEIRLVLGVKNNSLANILQLYSIPYIHSVMGVISI